MILNHFRAWARTATPAERAAGANALARAYLFSNLDGGKRGDALRILTGFLDDPSPTVRSSMAEALADSPEAPHLLILALADDQSSVASIVLHRSPVLSDAELIDCAATADAIAQAAIAARPSLSAPIAAALAEVAAPNALVVLARNAGATLLAFSIRRMLERHGDDAELREALLARPDLPPSGRVDLVAATTASLAAFVTGCNWMSDERMRRVSHEARDKAAVTIAETSRHGTADLVAHLRQTGKLTIGFMFRVILSGKIALFEAILADLSGLPRASVSSVVARCGTNAFTTLYTKAGLAPVLLPAFRIALRAAGRMDLKRGASLSRETIDGVLRACEAINQGEFDSLLVLLRRFESEAARDEARLASASPLALRAVPPLVLQADPARHLVSLSQVVPPPVKAPTAVPREPVAPRRIIVDLVSLEAELLRAA